ncbi:MAG: (2Fe-2S) ferredoxin domain-containing protein [Burkholderiales bacterium]
MGHYHKHVFFCVNQREPGEACCANHGSQAVRDYAKQRVKAIVPKSKGNIRVNTAGCMDRCSEGPVLVVYPEGVWYTYVDEHDIDEIIEQHLLNDRVVERLKI